MIATARAALPPGLAASDRAAGPAELAAIARAARPPELAATAPPEARGLARDGVRLLVAGANGIQHLHFRDIGSTLRPGDLLVVNTSATLPAAVDGVELREASTAGTGHRRVVVHFSTRLDDGSWVVELRSAPGAGEPRLEALPGEQISLPAGGRLRLLEPYAAARPSAAGIRLWRVRPEGLGGDVLGFLARHGRAIRYGHVPTSWPLSAYQTVFAMHPGSAEMPSAGRPFTAALVARLEAEGITIAPVTLHTGVSSLESDEPPYPERFEVPATTARLINATRTAGGRVLAVGTTAVRAVESAAQADGSVAASGGWTDLVLCPVRPARVVDGLVSGWHEPDSSHLLLLEAVVGAALVDRAYAAALEHRYLGHEFGDSCLLLRSGAAPPAAG